MHYPELSHANKRKTFGLNAAGLFGVDPEADRCEIAEDAIEGRRRMLDAELRPRRWTQRPSVGPAHPVGRCCAFDSSRPGPGVAEARAAPARHPA